MSNFLEEDDSPWSRHASMSATLSGSTNAFNDHMQSPWGEPEPEPETEDHGYDNPFAARMSPMQSAMSEEETEEPDSLALLSAAPDGPSKHLHFVHQDSPYGNDEVPSKVAGENKPSSTRRARKVTHKKVVPLDPLSGDGGDDDADPLGASLLVTQKAGPASDLDDVPLSNPTELDEVRLAMSRVNVDETSSPASDAAKSGAATPSAPSLAASVTPQPLTDPYEFQTPQANFSISVGDPSRVGDLTSAHTEYTVSTSTDFARYPKDSTVQRRYRDFRWLFRALQHSHPGIVVPPPPDKQAVGRFNDEFVENRRLALEQMLRRIAKHPHLHADADLEAFLTHPDFAEYLKTRVITEDELEVAASSGFMSTLLGRVEEPDVWLQEQRARLDRTEHELRTTYRIYESLLGQRKELSDALNEFSNATSALAVLEPTKRLGDVLQLFANVHEKISANLLRHRQQDMLSVGNQLEEQLRQVGSVRDALESRQRVASQLNTAQSDLEKKQSALDRVMRQGRSQADRYDALVQEVTQAKAKHEELKQQTRDVGSNILNELAHLDYQNFTELRSAIELLVESAIETQKEVIETWETFYSRCFASTAKGATAS